MKGFKQSKTKWLLTAVLVCTLSLAGIGAFMVNAGAATVSGIVYSAATGVDQVTVPTGTGYVYYTTANASKSVPAANQWIATNAGIVDIAALPKATTLYFAKTPQPASINDIIAVKIPAAPVLTTASYSAKGFNFVSTEGSAPGVDDKFKFETTVSVSTTVNGKAKVVNKKVSVDTNNIQVRFNDNAAWVNWNTATTGMTAAKLERLEHDGGNIYVRIAPSALGTSGKAAATIVTGTEEGQQTYQFNDNGNRFASAAAEGETLDNSIVRAGVSKAIKIAKRAVGPVPVVDYAKHTLTIAAGQSYAKLTKAATEPEALKASWTAQSVKETLPLGTNLTKAPFYYVIRTDQKLNKTTNVVTAPASLTTFFEVPIDEQFEASSSAVITGGMENGAITNATLKITNTAAASAYATKVAAANTIEDANAKAAAVKAAKQAAVAYQYAIVDLSDSALTGLISKTAYDWSNTAVKWKSASTGADGTVTVTLAAKAIDKKQILVRKAATKTTFSSLVEVFDAPQTATPCWRRMAQSAWADTFYTKHTGGTNCPSITSAKQESSNTFSVTLFGAAAADKAKCSLILPSKKVVVSSKVAVAKNVATITFDESDLEEITNKPVTLVFDEGFASAKAPAPSNNATQMVIKGVTITKTATE